MNIKPLVESLKRLYNQRRVDAQKIKEIYQSTAITEDELRYILGDTNS